MRERVASGRKREALLIMWRSVIYWRVWKRILGNSSLLFMQVVIDSDTLITGILYFHRFYSIVKSLSSWRDVFSSLLSFNLTHKLDIDYGPVASLNSTSKRLISKRRCGRVAKLTNWDTISIKICLRLGRYIGC